MRLTRFDRCLLLGCLLCLVLSLVCGQAFCACDEDCRQVQWYYQDQGAMGVNCYALKYSDCSPCALANGNCDNTKGLLPGTCQPNMSQQQKFAKGMGCVLKCNLAPKGFAEAQSGVSGTFANCSYFTCQD
jgi:hypothetical protein